MYHMQRNLASELVSIFVIPASRHQQIQCKSTETGYCEILYWEVQTVMQYQNSEDWNALPQSVVSAGFLALFKSRLSSHAAP